MVRDKNKLVLFFPSKLENHKFSEPIDLLFETIKIAYLVDMDRT